MKSSLIGLPSQPRIAIFKHEIVSVLRANPGFHNVSDISHTVIGHKLNHLVEFAKAIGELENEGAIKPATNGTKLFYQLASTADEAQGSTSRTVAGEKGAECRELPLGANAAGSDAFGHRLNTPSLSNEHSAPDFSILHRPHIVRSKEEVHMIFCSGGCERVAHGKCDCGVPLCNNCRYLPNGERSIFGDCKECSKVPQDSTEVFSNGRQV